ncbi:MAG TPA: zf-HC2 domain-containing protein [Gemmataceae bacterium]|jgi:hypothetical protein|nr:zf-HC2 domain-containing protein [Gemmataceae bacterium]
MTSCISNDELLWDYLHELLDHAQANQLEEHLATCSACQEALAIAKADCANLAAAALVDGPFPLFEIPTEVAPATIPLRSAWSPAAAGRWSWLAAAAVLFAVALPFAGYQMGSLQRSRALQEAETVVQATRVQRENFRDHIEQQETVTAYQLQAKHLRLQVHGPASFQANQANVFRVSTTNLQGQPIAAQVTARVARDGVAKPLFEEHLKSDGDLLVSLPAMNLTEGSKASLEFFADSSEGPERVREVVDIQPSLLATHLAVEKSVYHPGDRVLFRSVTLERSTWRPDSAAFAIRYDLKGLDGKVVASVAGMTRDGGIGGGDFRLPDDVKAGIYKLTAADADGRFAPVTRTLRIVTGPLPPPRLADIQFYPEGGNLIADVPTRIYFSARSVNDEPVEVEGVILDNKNREVGAVQSAALQGKPHLGGGRGFFALTPKKGEHYFLLPKNEATRHALPQVHETGLGLALANPVIRANEEIGVTIYAVNEQTPVVIGLFARGRMIAQQAATLHAGSNSIALAAPADLAGIYRVALFPTQPGAQMPLAERLGFCRADRKLPVVWETATRDGKRFLKIHSGAGTPEKSWLAVSVQPADDAQSLDHAIGNGLWSGLVLRQELPRSWPEENLGAFLRDEPAMAEALALYLGLQGPAPRPASQRVDRANRVFAGASPVGGQPVAMLNMDNVEGVKAKYSSALATQIAALREQGLRLADREVTAQGRSERARAELESYQERASALFKPLLGLLVVSLFAMGCIGLTVAIWRMVSNQPGARSWVLTSCGSLAACLVFVGLSPMQFGVVPVAQPLAPLPELAIQMPKDPPQIAMADQSKLQHPFFPISVGPNVPRPIIDRTKLLPVTPVQAKSLWLPAISSNDGDCEVELTVPPGKLGHVLHIDVFTASGRIGSTTALLK